jgi:hypothetical protein
MHAETIEQGRLLRSEITSERAKLIDLERRFNHPSMKQKAQRALEDLDLVEAALRSLEENRRTLAEELEALKTAQIPLGLAISARKLLEGEMKSRGPGTVLF